MNLISSNRKCKIVFAALIASSISPTVNAESSASAFRMMVVSDSPYGSVVLSGSYDAAIQKLSVQQSAKTSDYATYNNLCVAYTKSKNLEQATEACNAAVSLIEAKAVRAGNASRRNGFEYRNTKWSYAIALSNRGVLSVVKGDFDLAERDLRAAVDLDTRNERVTNNLVRLSNMPFSASGQGAVDPT